MIIFEWDAAKAKINLSKHGVSFEEAQTAFDDLNAVDALDETHSDDEPRYNLIGSTVKGLLFVVYAEPDETVVRLISARQATKFEQEIYAAK